MNVLILCNDFPPLNSIGAQRPYSWFVHFKKFGIQPTVVTKNWTGDVANRSDVLKTTGHAEVTTEQAEHGRIIRVPVKLIPPERMLIKYGEAGRATQRKMLTLLYKMLSFISFGFDKHAGIYQAADELMGKEKFDAILVTGEPFILFRYGYLLSKKHNTPWVADFRDGWQLNHVTSHETSLLTRVLKSWEFRFEKKYVKSAAHITSVDPYLTGELGKLHSKPYTIIYNGFDKFYEYKNAPAPSAQVVLTHTGTLTPGQQVEFLLQAVKELHVEKKITPADIALKFIGIEYFHAQWQRILNYDAGIKPYIITTARLPREKALEENAAADFLVSLTEPGYNAIYAKTYDYLAMKKPILVMTDDGSMLPELIKKTQTGFAFNTVNELKQFLLESIARKKKGEPASMVKPNEAAALFYTREQQTKALAETLMKLEKR